MFGHATCNTNQVVRIRHNKNVKETMDLGKDVLEAHVRSVHLPSVHNEPTKTLTCPVAHFEYRKQIEKRRTGNVC